MRAFLGSVAHAHLSQGTVQSRSMAHSSSPRRESPGKMAKFELKKLVSNQMDVPSWMFLLSYVTFLHNIYHTQSTNIIRSAEISCIVLFFQSVSS